MRTKYLLLALLISSFLILSVSVSAQPDDTLNSTESSEVHLPLLGWYVVPILGAMRRHRHELNERAYDRYTGNDSVH